MGLALDFFYLADIFIDFCDYGFPLNPLFYDNFLTDFYDYELFLLTLLTTSFFYLLVVAY